MQQNTEKKWKLFTTRRSIIWYLNVKVLQNQFFKCNNPEAVVEDQVQHAMNEHFDNEQTATEDF